MEYQDGHLAPCDHWVCAAAAGLDGCQDYSAGFVVGCSAVDDSDRRVVPLVVLFPEVLDSHRVFPEADDLMTAAGSVLWMFVPKLHLFGMDLDPAADPDGRHGRHSDPLNCLPIGQIRLQPAAVQKIRALVGTASGWAAAVHPRLQLPVQPRATLRHHPSTLTVGIGTPLSSMS